MPISTLVLKTEYWTLEEVVDFIVGTDDNLDPYTVEVMVLDVSPGNTFFGWHNDHGEGSGYFVAPKKDEISYYKAVYSFPQED